MSIEIDPEDFIAWRAETKTELKWIRSDIKKIAKNQASMNTKITTLCTDLGIMKAKMALYGAIGGFVISAIVIVVQTLLKGS